MARLSSCHYRWAWRLRANLEQLWEWVSDTNHFNADTRSPALGENIPLENRRLRFSLLGVKVEWEEAPFEWVRPFRFGVVQRYLSGPVALMRVLAELVPLPEGGTRLVYQVWVYPRNLLGVLAIPIQIGLISVRRFGAVFHQYDDWVMQGKAVWEAKRRTALPPSNAADCASFADS